MGFRKELYNEREGNLFVSFEGNAENEYYTPTNNLEEAMQYFNAYIKNYKLYFKTQEELVTEQTGIAYSDLPQIREKLNVILSSFTEKQAIANLVLYPKWYAGMTYKINDYVRYHGMLYKVLETHIATDNSLPTDGTYYIKLTSTVPEWVKPLETDGYMNGDIVAYENMQWESTCDDNIWEPGYKNSPWINLTTDNYELKDPIIPQDLSGVPLIWGQNQVYALNERVNYKGSTYISLIDANIWSPEAYPAGWQLVE